MCGDARSEARETDEFFRGDGKRVHKEQAVAETARCAKCELCCSACLADMYISQYIHQIWGNNLDEGPKCLYETNPLQEHLIVP